MQQQQQQQQLPREVIVIQQPIVVGREVRRGIGYLERGVQCCGGYRCTKVPIMCLGALGCIILLWGYVVPTFIEGDFVTGICMCMVGGLMILSSCRLCCVAHRDFEALPPNHPDRAKYCGVVALPLNGGERTMTCQLPTQAQILSYPASSSTSSSAAAAAAAPILGYMTLAGGGSGGGGGGGGGGAQTVRYVTSPGGLLDGYVTLPESQAIGYEALAGVQPFGYPNSPGGQAFGYPGTPGGQAFGYPNSPGGHSVGYLSSPAGHVAAPPAYSVGHPMDSVSSVPSDSRQNLHPDLPPPYSEIVKDAQ